MTALGGGIGSLIGDDGLIRQSILRDVDSVNGQALLLTIEGLPYAWTDNPHLAGQDYCRDGRTIKLGLVPPSYEHGINIIEGLFENNRMTVQILDDETEYMARLFASFDDDAIPVDMTIEPGDDLSARTDLYDRHIGTECIGPEGQRSQYPFIPGLTATIGKQHIGGEYLGVGIPSAEHTPVPTVMRGRRAALFRVYRDHLTHPDDEAQGWGLWEESDRLWFGELQDQGGVSRRTWTLEFNGAAAFTQGAIGSMTSTDGVPVFTGIDLRTDEGQDETRIAVSLYSRFSNNESMWTFGQAGQDSGDMWAFQIMGSDKTSIDVALGAALDDAEDAVGTHGAFSTTHGQRISWDGYSFTIQIDDLERTQGTRRRAAEALITMHEKAWNALGFSPREQGAKNREDAETLGDYYVDFYGGDSFIWRNPYPGESSDHNGIHHKEPAPGDGYWTARISTATKGDTAEKTIDNPGLMANLGAPRFYRALYNGGVSAIPRTPGFYLYLGFTAEARHPGQLDRPVSSDPSDASSGVTVAGFEADTQGIWMLRGPRVMRSGEDEEEEVQFVVASWRSKSIGSQYLEGDPQQIYVSRFLDPKMFGVDRQAVPDNDADILGWAMRQRSDENQVFAYPVFRLGYTDHEDSTATNRWHLAIRRLLMSTGASQGWDGFSDENPAIDTTINEPSDAVSVRMDAESREIGLGVPSALVASEREWSEAFAATGGTSSKSNSTWNLIVPPGVKAEDIIGGILKSFGLCLSIRGGLIGVVDPLATITPHNVDLAISTARSDGNPANDVTSQSTRAHSPINRFELAFGYNPSERDFKKDLARPVIDPGSRYRVSGDTWQASAFGMQKSEGYRDRIDAVSRFYARRHFMLEGYPLMRRQGMDAWPGGRVLVTDPQAVGQDGHYGINAYTGIIVRKREDTSSDGEGVTVDILVQDTVSRGFQLLAPMAIARGIDTDNNRILCHDNWARVAVDGWSDVAQFVEPTWSSIGGDADVQGWWVHSRSSTPDWSGTVESVLTTPGSAYLQLSGAVSGTYLRDRTYVVLLTPFASQGAAWVRALIATVGDSTGYFGSTRSSRWS